MKARFIHPTLFTSALAALMNFAAFAADVTGDRLDIGYNHSLAGTASSIAGGNANDTSASYTTIGGGLYNTNDAYGGLIGGGEGNFLSGNYSVIGGGYDNINTSYYSVIAGGYANDEDGDYTVIGGGYANTNNALAGAIGGGILNVANGDFATVAGGHSANASLYGQSAHASGPFAVPGDAQASEYVLRAVSSSILVTNELFLNGSNARLLIPTNTTWAFEALVAARGVTNAAGYQIKGVIKNTSGTTTLVGSAPTTVLGEDIAAWNVSASADDFYDALVIKAGGDTNTVRWVGTVRTTEVRF